MKKGIVGWLLVLGAVSFAPAIAQDGEWLPVRQNGDTTYFIHTSDYQMTENTSKNATGHVWLKIEDGKDITVIRARSDCSGQSVTIEDKYTNGEQVEGQAVLPVEPGTLAEIINRVVCVNLNFGD
ncbi:MAG: hypothetical protein IKI30_01110 [Oxalobacter sp.]|nr:hypothetical protein [Oxalobacter sp.]